MYNLKDIIKVLNKSQKSDLIEGEGFSEKILNKTYHTDVYELYAGSDVLKIWNTSNNAGIYDWGSLKSQIISFLLDDESTGHDLYDNSNSWAFEVVSAD